jgi:cell division protein YceG involved in septum cleavage
MSKPALEQIMRLQLDNFLEKIWTPYLELGSATLSQRLNTDGYAKVSLNPYQILTLSTVIEKEERNPDNKPTVA